MRPSSGPRSSTRGSSGTPSIRTLIRSSHTAPDRGCCDLEDEICRFCDGRTPGRTPRCDGCQRSPELAECCVSWRFDMLPQAPSAGFLRFLRVLTAGSSTGYTEHPLHSGRESAVISPPNGWVGGRRGRFALVFPVTRTRRSVELPERPVLISSRHGGLDRSRVLLRFRRLSLLEHSDTRTFASSTATSSSTNAPGDLVSASATACAIASTGLARGCAPGATPRATAWYLSALSLTIIGRSRDELRDLLVELETRLDRRARRGPDGDTAHPPNGRHLDQVRGVARARSASCREAVTDQPG